MRRFALYFAVALLAFGSGSLIVIKIHWTTKESITLKEKTILTETQKEKNVGRGFGSGSAIRKLNEPEFIPKLHKPTCSDKKLIPIWNELRKDKEFKDRQKEFYQEADCSDSIEIQRVDLNGDGQKEFIIWGRYNFSSATGNRVVWLYEKKKGKYKQLLQSYAYNDETNKWFEVKRAKSNGYHNLLLKTHYTASETTYEFYKFNGKKYIENKCLFYSYFIDEKKTTIMTCKEYTEQSEKRLREKQDLLKNQ
jgi:hypothetical protein